MTDNKPTSVFQIRCTEAVTKLTDEDIEKFESAIDSASRIRCLYECGRTLLVNLPDNGKDIRQAELKKTEGNQFFARKNYKKALSMYNEGILACPQDSEGGKELLTIIVSNRSATYFEMKDYKKVFNDIDYVTVIGSYPRHLLYKIWVRKARCYDALQNEKLCNEAFDEAVKCLVSSNLDRKMIDARMKEIEAVRRNKMPPTHYPYIPIRNPDPFVPNTDYIALSEKAVIAQSEYQGRYAVAKTDIPVGTIIVQELPHSFVISASNRTKNCQNCSVSVGQPIPCGNCGYVVFCSTYCERLANKGFHKYECCFQQAMFNENVSVNCSLALRIITQRPLQLFKDKYNKLKDYLFDDCEKPPIKKKNYRFDDYDNVFFLCRNEKTRDKGQLLHLTFMAIYLLRLLKLTCYLGQNTADDVLTDEEVYIGCLILRHLEILQYNAHEMSEVRPIDNPVIIKGVKTFYDNHSIGAAVYPTLALFNHSCDASVARYNMKSKIVVRAIKPIAAGETIYENYGPMYMSTDVEERRANLREMYAFECNCIPCIQNWPKFEQLDSQCIKIRCKKEGCPTMITVKMNADPVLTCPDCSTSTTIFKCLGALMFLEEILPKAEDYYMAAHFYQAMEKYINALTILYEYTEPPHPEMITVQQRIKVCMVHMGSTSFDYVCRLGYQDANL